MTGKPRTNRYTPDMSTIAEIKSALSHLTPTECDELEGWFSEHRLDESPENLARIQRKLDEVDPAKARPWTDADWARVKTILG